MTSTESHPPPDALVERDWWRPGEADWWMGALFVIGSARFAAASFVTQWASVPRPGLGVAFFAGSIFYTLPPNATHVTIMRALVKQTLGHTLAETLAADIAQACDTLRQKGGLHALDRRRVKTATGL